MKQRLSTIYRSAFGLKPVARKARAWILKPVRLEAAAQTEAIGQVSRATDDHAREISALRADHSQEISTLRAGHAQEISELRAAQSQETDALRVLVAAQSNAAAEARAEISRVAQHVTALRKRIDSLQAQVTLDQQLLIGDPQLPIPHDHENGSPLISVILPTHNRAQAVVDAIESVRAQTLTRWELIVVNDGSSDGTELALRRFAGDERVRVVAQEHRGVSAARNRGIAAAKADFVSFLDSDCLYYPGFLAAAVSALQADPVLPVVYGALVTDDHQLPGSRVLFRPFERSALLQGNFIDVNALAARKSTLEGLGGFDESLDRLVDWDLVLRATMHRPAKALPVLAARYRVLDNHRVTTSASLGVNAYRVRRKLHAAPALPRAPRVLYLVWHYPQLSESYVETEIRVMRRWGVEVAVWGEVDVASPYDIDVPLFRGSPEAAIETFRADLIHLHWLTFASSRKTLLEATGLPVTLRAHGFEVSHEVVLDLLAQPWMRRLYGFPHQVHLLDGEHPRMRGVVSGFDTSLFAPNSGKNRRLVVRTSAGLPSKDLGLFFEIAVRRPEFRFVLAAVTCKDRESYIGELQDMNARLGSPVDLQIDLPRDQIARLVGDAGIYLHTLVSPGHPGATPIGMPISIAEAMGTGAIPIVKDLPEFADYAGDAGLRYGGLDHLDRLLAEILDWPDARWREQWHRAVDRAFMLYADEIALRPIYDDWISMLRPRLACS